MLTEYQLHQIEDVIKKKLKIFKRRQTSIKYYRKNRDKLIKKNTLWNLNHPEKTKISEHKYQQTQNCKIKNKIYYQNNKEHIIKSKKNIN